MRRAIIPGAESSSLRFVSFPPLIPSNGPWTAKASDLGAKSQSLEGGECRLFRVLGRNRSTPSPKKEADSSRQWAGRPRAITVRRRRYMSTGDGGKRRHTPPGRWEGASADFCH